MVYADIIPQCPEVKKNNKMKIVKNINKDVYEFRPNNKKNIYMYDNGNIIYIGKITGYYGIVHNGTSRGSCNLQNNDNIKIWIKGNYIRELDNGYIFEGKIEENN